MNGPIYIPTSNKDRLGLNQKDVQQIVDASVGPIKNDLDKATATSSGSVGGTLVRRDANKDFEGSKVKLWHLESAGPVLSIAGNNETQTLNIGSGSDMQTINVGNNGTGATTINLGGGSDQVKVNLPLKNASGANVLHVSGPTSVGSANVAVGSNVLPSSGGYGNTLIGRNVIGDHIGRLCCRGYAAGKH